MQYYWRMPWYTRRLYSNHLRIKAGMLKPLVWSATTMGASAAGYAMATCHTLALPLDPPLVLLAFVLVQALYLRDWLSGSHGDDDATNQPVKTAWLQRHRSQLKGLAMGEGVLALLIIGARPAVLAAIIPGIVFVLLYTARVLPGKRSLKQLPGMKLIMVGGLWNLLSVWIQYLFNSHAQSTSIGAAAVAGVCNFGCIAALVNLNDLRDVEGDAKAGTRTLPVALGRSAARSVSIALAVMPVLVGTLTGARGLAATGLYVAWLAVLYDPRWQGMWSLLFDLSGPTAALSTMLLR